MSSRFAPPEPVLVVKPRGFNWESLLVIPFLVVLGLIMFYLIKPSAERKARHRYEKIKKTQ
jgi:hypothetical protein